MSIFDIDLTWLVAGVVVGCGRVEGGDERVLCIEFVTGLGCSGLDLERKVGLDWSGLAKMLE